MSDNHSYQPFESQKPSQNSSPHRPFKFIVVLFVFLIIAGVIWLAMNGVALMQGAYQKFAPGLKEKAGAMLNQDPAEVLKQKALEEVQKTPQVQYVNEKQKQFEDASSSVKKLIKP